MEDPVHRLVDAVVRLLFLQHELTIRFAGREVHAEDADVLFHFRENVGVALGRRRTAGALRRLLRVAVVVVQIGVDGVHPGAEATAPVAARHGLTVAIDRGGRRHREHRDVAQRIAGRRIKQRPVRRFLRGVERQQMLLAVHHHATAYGMGRHRDVEASLVGRDPGLHEPRHATERPEADLRHAAGPEFAFELDR